jgi:hypothetical protein
LTPEAGARRLLQEAFQLLPGIEIEVCFGELSCLKPGALEPTAKQTRDGYHH